VQQGSLQTDLVDLAERLSGQVNVTSRVWHLTQARMNVWPQRSQPKMKNALVD